MKRILLGVTGSIAAPEAVKLAEKLAKNGYAVDVILTEAAARFVAPRNFEAATGRAVHAGPLAGVAADEGEYLSLARDADLAVIAPATANTIAKLAAGVADNLLTITTLALEGTPVLICPSMDAAIYRNPLTQRNRRVLENLGFYFFGPRDAGRGKGALAETNAIVGEIGDMLNPELWGAYI